MMQHELKQIAQLETKINKNITDFKMKIVNYLKENTESLNHISINRKNGYLKIETRHTLPDELINDLNNEFSLTLDYSGMVAVESNELYKYIFKPN